jgi:hypothetical protein
MFVMIHWTTKKAYASALGALLLLVLFAQYACACRQILGPSAPADVVAEQMHAEDHSCCENEPAQLASKNSLFDQSDNCCCSSKVQQDVVAESTDVFSITPHDSVSKFLLALSMFKPQAIQLDVPDMPRGPPERARETPLYILWRSLVI